MVVIAKMAEIQPIVVSALGSGSPISFFLSLHSPPAGRRARTDKRKLALPRKVGRWICVVEKREMD